MDLASLTEQDIKAELAPAPDHDFETDDWHRLTLNRDLDEDLRWWKVDCPACGGKHIIAWDGESDTTFECDRDGKGTKVAVAAGSDTDPDN